MRNYQIKFIRENKVAEAKEDVSLLQVQIDAGLQPDAPCGGRGTCGKCILQIRQSVQEEWQTVRACQTSVHSDLEVRTPLPSQRAQILTDSACTSSEALSPQVECVEVHVPANRPGESVAERELFKTALRTATGRDGWQISLPVAAKVAALKKHSRSGGALYAVIDADRVLDVSEAPQQICMAAFDIGTTSIAGYLLRTDSLEPIAARGMLNPQRQFGADIISRADYALEHGAEALARCVHSAIDGMLGDLCADAGVDRRSIYALSIVGNTCIHHLFLGIVPESLTVTPYNPVISEPLLLRAADFELNVHPEATLRILPVIAGFVGADTVGCLVAEDWERIEPITLMIDIGTNGEIVLGNRERMIACSTAAGPAFEGAKIACGMRGMRGAIDRVRLEDGQLRWHVIGDCAPVGICGSGLIDLIAALHACGEIDAYGKLACGAEYRLEGTDVVLTQRDVREVQLAKAAICAGIRLLAAQLGIGLEQIEQVHLAGAFGNYMDPANACAIGLIPMELREKIHSIGNAAGEGAKRVLLEKNAWQRASQFARQAEFLELASLSNFQDEFVDALEFPEPEDEQ